MDTPESFKVFFGSVATIEPNDVSQKISPDVRKGIYEYLFDKDACKTIFNFFVFPYEKFSTGQHDLTWENVGSRLTASNHNTLRVNDGLKRTLGDALRDDFDSFDFCWVDKLLDDTPPSLPKKFPSSGHKFTFNSNNLQLRLGNWEAGQCSSFGRMNSSMTFADKDMVVPKKHNRPLYFPFNIAGVTFRRALVDNGAAVNIMPLSTFEVAKISKNRLTESRISITGAFGEELQPLGHVMVDLQLGPIRSETGFHVVNINSVNHVILGRPWIHQHQGIPSTYGQWFEGIFQGKRVKIKASQTPFDGDEVDLPGAYLYMESVPNDNVEESPCK